jgi:potassium-dependent mechanosensitive channel
MLRWLSAILFAALACAVIPAPSQAQGDQKNDRPPAWATKIIGTGANSKIIEQFSPTLTQTGALIADIQDRFKKRGWLAKDLDQATEQLTKSQDDLRTFADGLAPKLADAKARLSKLGPPPKEGQTEPDPLADQRKSIADDVGAYDALVKQAEVLRVQAGQVIASFNKRRRNRFVRGLLRQSDGFRQPEFWSDAAIAVPQQAKRLFDAVSLLNTTAWYWLSAALLLLIGLTVFVADLFHRLLRSGKAKSSELEIPRMKRGAMVLWRAAALSAPVFASLGMVLLIASSFDLVVGSKLQVFAHFFIYVGVATFLISALHFALVPGASSERLINIESRAARRIAWILTLYILVWLSDQIFALLDAAFLSPLPLVVVRSLLTAIVFGLLLTSLLFVRIERRGAHPSTRRTNGWPRALFALIAFVALFIVGAALLGYVSLARFVGSQLVATGGLALFLMLVHLTAEFISTPRTSDLANENEEANNGHGVISTTLGVLIGLALDLLVLLMGVPLLLLQWGYDWPEVRAWLASAVFGFQIGGLRLSLLTIFTSIGILFAGVVLTRLMRNTFVRRSRYLFSDSSGARDSIATVLSYAGFVLSVIAALSYLGVEVANIALMAGALFVGIGFGLQSIANNLISGLILLAERPIKTGDWIIVGDREGRVQKISVRSTQIRTFDRSTVIVPNADLITGQVVNWDHGDTIGRVLINIGVSYDADPRQVIEILSKLGASHSMVMRSDVSPKVVFEGFGENSMDFSLRVLLKDIRHLLAVQTDLRVWIVEAFRENNIKIPFPQRDLHLVELPKGSGEAPKVEEQRSDNIGAV